MKTVALALVAFAVTTSHAHAARVENTRTAGKVEIARVVRVIPLVAKSDLRVAVAVQDLGGSTDVSPTQAAFFTLYAKGEMFSTDATFELGAVYNVLSARRVSGGRYSVDVEAVDFDTGMPVRKTLRIDARKAVMDIQSVRCEEFDCEASEAFKSTIEVSSD